MFCYNPGKILVASPLRCGHTAMKRHFGLDIYNAPEAYNTIDHWVEHDGVKTIVLRHPIERFWSARRMYEAYFGRACGEYDRTQSLEEAAKFHHELFGKTRSFHETRELVKIFVGHDLEDRIVQRNIFIYKAHSAPFMHKILNESFKYIPFESLNNYIGKLGLITETKERYLDETFDDDNGFYTRDELYKDAENYEHLIANKEIMSVDEWNRLTK